MPAARDLIDEISVLLLLPSFETFGRGVEKLVSLSASIVTATFTLAAGEWAATGGTRSRC